MGEVGHTIWWHSVFANFLDGVLVIWIKKSVFGFSVTCDGKIQFLIGNTTVTVSIQKLLFYISKSFPLFMYSFKFMHNWLSKDTVGQISLAKFSPPSPTCITFAWQKVRPIDKVFYFTFTFTYIYHCLEICGNPTKSNLPPPFKLIKAKYCGHWNIIMISIDKLYKSYGILKIQDMKGGQEADQKVTKCYIGGGGRGKLQCLHPSKFTLSNF